MFKPICIPAKHNIGGSETLLLLFEFEFVFAYKIALPIKGDLDTKVMT